MSIQGIFRVSRGVARSTVLCPQQLRKGQVCQGPREMALFSCMIIFFAVRLCRSFLAQCLCRCNREQG